jgi:hypothetical protein
VKEKGRQWAKFLSDLLVKTDIRPNPVLLQPRGLASVPDGFQYMREGKVRIRAGFTLRSIGFFFSSLMLPK